jgi:hypothetical protein
MVKEMLNKNKKIRYKQQYSKVTTKTKRYGTMGINPDEILEEEEKRQSFSSCQQE